MRVRYHPEADAELQEQRDWYSVRSPLTAFKFAQAIDTAISRIRDAPLRYPIAEFETLEFVLPSPFRFTVVYRIGDDEIIIVAVAHHSRKPGYWRLR